MLIGASAPPSAASSTAVVGAARARRQPRGRHARGGRRDRAVRLPRARPGAAAARARRCPSRSSSASTSARTAPFRGLDGKVPSPVFGFFVVGIALALGLLVANLRRSNLGQRMLAVRSNERAAAAAGINVRNVKLAAFGISSFIAGIARRAVRLQLQLGHGHPLLRPDRAQPDRLRLRRRHHDGLGRGLRRPDLGRGAGARTRSRSGSGSRATGRSCSAASR